MRDTYWEGGVMLAVCLAIGTGAGQHLETTVRVGMSPSSALWNPLKDKAYFGCDVGGVVSVINGATNEVTATIPVGEYPISLTLNTRADKVYCLMDGGRLLAIDSDSDTVMSTLRFSGDPRHMAYCSTLNKLYVAGYGVRVIDCGSQVVTDSISLGHWSMQMVFDDLHRKVYCSVWQGEGLYHIDAWADTLLESLSLGADPYALCRNRINSRVYVGDAGDSLVYVIRDTTTNITELAGRAGVPSRQGATLVRGVLLIPASGVGRGAPCVLLDISGRGVQDLLPGPNDVSRLPQGVYFVVTASPFSSPVSHA